MNDACPLVVHDEYYNHVNCQSIGFQQSIGVVLFYTNQSTIVLVLSIARKIHYNHDTSYIVTIFDREEESIPC